MPKIINTAADNAQDAGEEDKKTDGLGHKLAQQYKNRRNKDRQGENRVGIDRGFGGAVWFFESFDRAENIEDDFGRVFAANQLIGRDAGQFTDE